MSDEHVLYSYRIDRSDRIISVDSAWLEFAQQNEAPELTEDAVLGEPIWGFITGKTVQRLYRDLFATLRSDNAETMLPFRCDSPGIVRHMELLVRSGPSGSINLTGRLTHTEEREPISLFSRHAARGKRETFICSLCRRLEIGGEWLSIDEAIVRRRWFASNLPPRLKETVCPDCRKIRA